MSAEHDFHTVGEFAIPFASAMVKLRKGRDEDEAVTLSADEVEAICTALQLLQDGGPT